MIKRGGSKRKVSGIEAWDCNLACRAHATGTQKPELSFLHAPHGSSCHPYDPAKFSASCQLYLHE